MSKNFPIPGRPRPDVREAPKPPEKYKEGLVGRVLVGLTHQEYFLEDQCFFQTPIGLLLTKAYSTTRERSDTHVPGKLLGITRHDNLQFVAMGLVIEEVPTPSWWDRRDDGLL